jgi:hypothetical protein
MHWRLLPVPSERPCVLSASYDHLLVEGRHDFQLGGCNGVE